LPGKLTGYGCSEVLRAWKTFWRDEYGNQGRIAP
jgi:hypothetical protein